MNDCQLLKLKIFNNLQCNEHIHLFNSLLFCHSIRSDTKYDLIAQKSTKVNLSLLMRMETLVYLYMYWEILWTEFVLNSKHINVCITTLEYISESAMCMYVDDETVFLVNEFQPLNWEFHSLQFYQKVFFNFSLNVMRLHVLYMHLDKCQLANIFHSILRMTKRIPTLIRWSTTINHEEEEKFEVMLLRLQHEKLESFIWLTMCNMLEQCAYIDKYINGKLCREERNNENRESTYFVVF